MKAALPSLAGVQGREPQMVAVLDVGEGYGVVGASVEAAIASENEAEPHLAIVLTVVGAKPSDLMPTRPVRLVLGELGRIPIAELRRRIEMALRPEEPAS